MTQIQDVLIATGIEMFEKKYFGENSGNDLTMWIKWRWNPSEKTNHWAPVVEVFQIKQQDSTHKVKDKDFYFKLPEQNGVFNFEAFIGKFVSIERLKK